MLSYASRGFYPPLHRTAKKRARQNCFRLSSALHVHLNRYLYYIKKLVFVNTKKESECAQNRRHSLCLSAFIFGFARRFTDLAAIIAAEIANVVKACGVSSFAHRDITFREQFFRALYAQFVAVFER